MLEVNETMLLPNIYQANKTMREKNTFKKWGFPKPVYISEYLGRKQFYRQNGLPVELNLMIEEAVVNDLYIREIQQDNYKRIVGYFKEKAGYLNEIEQAQQEIKEEEKQEQEKEVQELLAKEIKEQREK
jgi:hypothetical protein